MIVLAVALGPAAVYAENPGEEEPIRIGGEIVVDASRQAVWRALTTPEGLAYWIAPESKVELTLGGPYELYFFPDEPEDRGMEGTVVLAYVPEELLVTSGEIEGTWSVWRLDDAADGRTRIRFDGLGHGDEWRQRSSYFAEATPEVLARLRAAIEPAMPGEGGGDPPAPSGPLAAFAPFLQRSWKGLVDPDKQIYDVARWELALNGQAIRMLHSVGDGAYGGETLVMWDREREELVYTYFTTDGFYTSGTMSFDDKGRLHSHERVTGNESGITEVRAVMELLPDGRMKVRTRMLRDSDWENRDEVVYIEDSDAEVVLP